MAALNTQLTINFTEPSSKNAVSVSYKPSEFQAWNYSTNAKGLDSVLTLGTKTNVLHGQLSKLNTLLTSQVNIHEHLASQGVQNVKPELAAKKLIVSKLLNSLPSQKLEQVISLLTSLFIKDDNFYDFSLGMLDVVSEKIKTDLNGDFARIKRRIDDSWYTTILIESVNGYSYQAQSKTSSFSFKDNYAFTICDVGGVNNVTKTISSMFGSSIKPYTDIFMEKIVSDAFRTIHSYGETPYGIHNQIEKLAWNLFQEDGSKRHLDSEPDIYSQFDEIVAIINEGLVGASYFCPPPFSGLPKRQITAAVSASDDVLPRTTKINYKDFSTYHNTYYYNFLELKKKGIVTPSFQTLSEIRESIIRTKRYFSVFTLGGTSITKMLEQKESMTTFENVVSALETVVSEIVNAVCLLYQEDSGLSL
jgi:hypothetical protein